MYMLTMYYLKNLYYIIIFGWLFFIYLKIPQLIYFSILLSAAQFLGSNGVG